MSKPWSKATPEQRERHRQACIAAGKWRRSYNWVCKVCDEAETVGIDGIDFLTVILMIQQNDKWPVSEEKAKLMKPLLQRKINPGEVYQIVFAS